jgi:hypothetical protein
LKLIALFTEQPKWFDVKPARKARKLGGLASMVVVRECISIAGTCFINFRPEEILPKLGAYLPFGAGTAHPGYLEVCHVYRTTRYRIFFCYLEKWPEPALLWEQEGLPPFVKQVTYRKKEENNVAA